MKTEGQWRAQLREGRRKLHEAICSHRSKVAAQRKITEAERALRKMREGENDG